jgi:alpha-L-rhamnosidase
VLRHFVSLIIVVWGSAFCRADTPIPIGSRLQDSFVWTQASGPVDGYMNAVFRKTFDLSAAPREAKLSLFAYTRYQLYVNGAYVGRGPNRFENRRPEYDTWDLQSRFHSGKNVIAVLVHRDWSLDPKSFKETLSRFRNHAPGFTVSLDLTGPDGTSQMIVTDPSWTAVLDPSQSRPEINNYSSIPDNIDAQKSPGNWADTNFDDSAWPHAVKVVVADPVAWPVLSPRTIPLLREADVPFTVSIDGKASSQPDLSGPGEMVLHGERIVQAYWVFDIDAEAGARILVTPLLPENHRNALNAYVCRAGKQRWMGGDTFAFKDLQIQVTGKASVHVVRLTEVLYPFQRVGTFNCSDPELNQVWKLTARSLELLSEDAYTDCADRERSEWMDNDPPMYDATRVMMAGPGDDGAPIWSDPRLFKNMLRRVALTQEPDGMLRARTCSELIDIHTRMEDRSCDWVEGLRKYYEATGDKDLVRELSPYLNRLLDWFASRRTARGLIRAREWVAWDNPLSYATCEGAANNAFIECAFADAAYLEDQVGDKPNADKWAQAAQDLDDAFNKELWDEEAGAYYSSVGTPVVLPGDDLFKKKISLQVVNGHTEPTLFSNLFALDQGLVPADRKARVINWVIAHQDEIHEIMVNDYFWKLLYSLDEPKYDELVLDRIRTGWKGMIESPWQTTWEKVKGGSKVHCYGIVPGYTLSTWVLGVRRDAPVWEKRIVIEPHLGNLTEADGVVVTEFGPVSVSWKKEKQWQFQFTAPENIHVTLALPNTAGTDSIKLDGASQKGEIEGSRLDFDLTGGRHQGAF